MEGYFFAGLAVASVQYLRLRKRPLLPLVVLFAALAAAETREEWDPWQDGLRLIAGAAALALVAQLSRDGSAGPASAGPREGATAAISPADPASGGEPASPRPSR